ncbi:MAG: hypothetical protein WBL65_16530 [Bryobacteraceae bacterium]
MKKLHSIPKLVVLLLAAAAALHAQTLNISPNPLNITVLANAGATAYLTLTSTGAPITIYSVTPTVSSLHASLPASPVTTPQTITVTVDPLAAGASPYTGYLSVSSSDSATVHSVPVNVSFSGIGVYPSTLALQYTAGSTSFPAPVSSTLTVPPGVTVSAPTANSGGSWLQAAVTGTPPTVVTALVNTSVAQTLAPGTYTGFITITPTTGAPATVQVTLVVSAAPQLTVAPSSLSFYYQVNGTNNQTSQQIVLTAGAQNFNFSFPTYPTWISLDRPSGTVLAGQSLTVTVTVTPPSSCTSSCSGNLVLNTTPGATQNISVTLTVSTNPLLNVNTTAISFPTYQMGTTPPAAVSLTPGSTGAALSYTVTPSTAWLTVTPTSGTTPTPVSIGVNPINLLPGTYNGTVSFLASGVTQSISVTLTVTNNPVLVASPALLWFAFQSGQALPASQTINLTSSNGAPLLYNATSTASWLILTSQTSGTTDSTLTASVNISGLSAGTYNGQIAITATNQQTGAALTAVDIPVTLYVSSNALLLVTPPQPFTAQAYSGQSAAQQNVTLASTSTDVLNLTWSLPTAAPWLLTSTPPGSTPSSFGLQATPPANLAPGIYSANVSVSATGPAGAVLDSPVTIPVVLRLTSGTINAPSPAALSFSQSVGASAPPAQSVAVTSTPPGLTFIPSPYDQGFGWLSVSSSTNTTNGSFSVSVDGSKLSTGTYTGKVVVFSEFAAGSPAVIPVTLTVTPGTISAPTTTLSFTQVRGGAAPAAQNVTVSGSPIALNFTAAAGTTDGNAWLTVTPQTGTTPATLQIGLSAVAGTLPVGSYNGTVTITSAGAGGSPINIPVTMAVVAPQTLTAVPASLSFSYIVGQTAPPAQTFQISASGGAAPFSVTTPSSATWLQVSPTSGSTPATVSVAVNTQGVAAGNYTAAITINSPNSTTAASVTVTFTVTQITVKPTAITNAASYAAGYVSPGELVAVFGTSIGPLAAAYGTLNASGTLLNTSAGSTRVLFDGVPAPVIYASATQTNVVVPYEVAGRPTTSVVVEYQGVQSTPLIYNVQAAAPGIFTQNYSGSGPGAILNQDGVTGNGPGTLAAKGSVVSVYMTGEGQTSPAGVTGAIAPVNVPAPWKQTPLKATATVSGLPAVVEYYGSAPGLVSGVMQVNVRIPANAASGAVPIVITLTDAATGLSYSTQAQVTVSVQ